MRTSKFAELAARRPIQLAIFVVLALALRWATFGDLNRHADETFYFLVGQRMHEGILPYVDVWDRKPLGLFLIYYLIAGISTSVLSYQIAACLFTAATMMIICVMVTRWSGWRGGILAGLAYLFSLDAFEGATGQTPDFYNPLIAGAALLLVDETNRFARREVSWRTWCAMALCGLALTVKQTTLFEAVFLGLYVLICLARAGTSFPKLAGIGLVCCALGALPTLLIGLFYFTNGHWSEFWHAMVTSNLAKAQEGQEAWRSLSIAVKAAPLLILALWGLLLPSVDRRWRIFVAAWTGAALVGFVSVPNFYGHYTLPLLVPLSVAAGFMLGQFGSGFVAITALALYSLLWYNPADAAWARENIRAMREMTRTIRQHDPGGGLLVFDGPIYLYALADERFLSPLVFPQHLNHRIENNVSHLDTHAEIDRIVAAGPGVIVMSRFPRSFPVNRYARERILDYARRNCRIVAIENVQDDPYRDVFVIFGDCRNAKGAAITAPSIERAGNGGRSKD